MGRTRAYTQSTKGILSMPQAFVVTTIRPPLYFVQCNDLNPGNWCSRLEMLDRQKLSID